MRFGYLDEQALADALSLGSLATQDTINGGDWSGTALSVSDGGTGSTTPTDALANLGVLSAAGNGTSVTGTLVETTLATILIPANSLGLNGYLDVIALANITGTAGAKTISIRLGGVFCSSTPIGSTVLSFRLTGHIMNKNSAGSQVSLCLANTSALPTAAVDTTVNQNLTITATLANVGDTLSLEHYFVRAFYA